MKGKILKSTVVHAVGWLTTKLWIGGFHPVTMALFMAIWCSRLIRFPALPIMSIGIMMSTGLLSGIKYGLVMFTIMIVYIIMEERHSRVPIITGSLLGGGVLTVMEVMDLYMSNGSAGQYGMAIMLSILAVSLSIIFYRIIEMLQMPRDKERKKQEEHGYKEKLNSYEERMNSIADAFSVMAKSIDGVTDENISLSCGGDGVIEYCPHCMSLMRQMDIYKNKLLESRKLLAMQLEEISHILGECAENTYDFRNITKEQMARLTEGFRDVGVVLEKMVCLDDRRGISELILTMKTKRGRCASIRTVVKLLEDVFDKKLEPLKEHRRIVGNSMETYRFAEKPNYYVMHGIAKTNSEEISGDSFSCMELESGQTLLGISDGMGTGLRACKDSKMVLGLLEKLMECGFGEDSALRLINTLFVLQGENATPATVDMGIIDRYSGVCDFMKLGAASTYVKRGNWVEAIRSTSLPMGGEGVPDIESASKKLYDGDYVIMMSDGLVETVAKSEDEDAIGEILLQMKSGKPQDMANEILGKVRERFAVSEEEIDDMTVLVTGIWNYSKCS